MGLEEEFEYISSNKSDINEVARLYLVFLYGKSIEDEIVSTRYLQAYKDTLRSNYSRIGAYTDLLTPDHLNTRDLELLDDYPSEIVDDYNDYRIY